MPSVLVALPRATAAGQTVLPSNLTWVDWLQAGLIVVVAIVAAQVLQRVLVRVLERGESEQGVAVLVGRFLGYLLFVIGLLYALRVLGVSLGPVLGALGVGGIALAFALQDVLQNAVAGILLQVRRPFRRGHQIRTLDYEGVVRDVNLRTVLLHTFDGLDVFVPNRTVLQNPIVNYTRTPLRRTTLEVGVSYATDLERARQVVLAAASGADGVAAVPAPEVWVSEFADSQVTLSVLFWHPAPMPDTWRVRSNTASAVHRALRGAGIEIPFPQVTVWRGDVSEA